MQSPYILAPIPSGGDDQPALQACINSAPDGTAILFPCQAAYQLFTPLSLFSRSGLHLFSFSNPDTMPIGRRGTEFVWKGNGGAAAFNLNYCHRVTLEGFALSLDASATPPVAGISVDQAPVSGQTPSITTTTACSFKRCLVVAPPSVPGMSFSAVSKQNVDLMAVQDCIFNGGSEGIRWGSNSNQKSEVVERCQFNGCGTAVHMLSGMLTVRDCTAQSCGVAATATTPATGGDVWIESGVQFCRVTGWNSESCKGLVALWLASSSCCFEVQSCRWDNLQSTAAIFARSTTPGGSVILRGCEFGGNQACNALLPAHRSTTTLVLDGCQINLPAWNGQPVPPPDAGGTYYPGLRQFGQPILCHGTGGF